MKEVNPDLRLNFNRECDFQKILVPTVHGVYVGGTCRCFETRKKEHVRKIKSLIRGSNSSKTLDLQIPPFTLETPSNWLGLFPCSQDPWRTSSINHEHNNLRPLPNQYFLKKITISSLSNCFSNFLIRIFYIRRCLFFHFYPFMNAVVWQPKAQIFQLNIPNKRLFTTERCMFIIRTSPQI